MLRRAIEWVLSLALIALAISVLYGALSGGRWLPDDIGSVVHAVLTSGQPVDALIPPCIAEDSPGPCYWDADTMGNGLGHSFTVDQFGHVTYWNN